MVLNKAMDTALWHGALLSTVATILYWT